LQQRCERSRGTTRPDAFPEDFAVFARFNRELRAIPERHPAPDPLPLTAVEEITSKLDTGRRAPADPRSQLLPPSATTSITVQGQNGTRSPTPRFPSAD
jgi:hypothetical protein